MLEKIGLPAKPSMRGANWVIDASHCQGCSSPFTFINRKHHCRRCGGIFCNSCTQQRMVLRGQGDSPVRICDPCKKLEEAARFELRYGHTKRVAKAGSKQISKTEDELLGEILGADEKHFMPSRKVADKVSVIPRTESTASSASSSATANDLGREEDSSNSIEGHNDAFSVTGSNSPEDLRQQAMEEKRRYRTLKAEGKAEEALKVFKRAKELERQAGALEIAIRKNRKIAAKVSNSSSSVSVDKIDEQGVSSKKKSIPLRDKEEKDDLFNELREMGWSDADIHDAGKKADLSLEGEFSNLLGETFQKSEISKKKGGIDKTPVLALKRKALLLKREGRLAEAKEELKQAKLLEKQLEEQELLGEASDSEDELSAIINSMDDDNQDNLDLDYHLDVGASFEHLLGAKDDPSFDENLEITDNDMNDPVLAAALKSLGWSEEDELVHETESVPLSQEALQAEVLNLKKEALSQKRAGNVPEAMALLKKAKLLEQKLERVQSAAHMCPTELNQSGGQQIFAPKSKMVIQKELLALKKKALALRREGRLEEADEQLKKGKLLEQQLEELENASKKPVTKSSKKIMEPNNVLDVDAESLDLGMEHVEPDVTDQDMHDPAMLSSLKSMGWNDDAESDYVSTTKKVPAPSNNPSAHESDPFVMPWKLMRNKAEIQKELLSIKRKALALRRQGKTEEAEEELERAKDLEKEIEEIESRHLIQQEKHCFHDVGENARRIFETEDVQRPALPLVETIMTSGKEKDASISEFEAPKTASADLIESGQANEISGKEKASNGEKVLNIQDNSETTSNNVNGINAYKDEILALKRNALTLKKEGKLKEAKEELRKAKLLEKSHEGQEKITDDKPAPVSTSANSVVMQKPISSHDRFKLQQESLHHKRNALKLRREGKIQESEAEFEKAKVLENQLEELGAQGSSSTPPVSDVVVEDLLDPQLMSILKSIGWDDKDLMPKPVPKPSSQPVPNKVEIPSRVEKAHLEEQIKAEKVRALNLKRAGKQDEALEALRSAKKLEKKLASLT